jgi:DNA-binding NarL/FixJ family response regulator
MVETAEFYAKTDRPVDMEPTVVLIDKRTLIRECLALGLQEKLLLPIATYSDLQNWSHSASTFAKCVIVVSGQGVASALWHELLRELSVFENAPPVIILAEAPSAQNVADALRCGARGFIPMEMSLDVAAEAIQLVLAGGCFIPANVMDLEGPQDGANPPQTRASTDFTQREHQVVEALLKGKSNKVIAYDIGLAESSVKYHIRSVFRKLRARNRTEAVTKLSQIIRCTFSR